MSDEILRHADIDQITAEATGARLDALARQGICTHGWMQWGVIGPRLEDSRDGVCKDCGKTFASWAEYEEERSQFF